MLDVEAGPDARHSARELAVTARPAGQQPQEEQQQQSHRLADERQRVAGPHLAGDLFLGAAKPRLSLLQRYYAAYALLCVYIHVAFTYPPPPPPPPSPPPFLPPSPLPPYVARSMPSYLHSLHTVIFRSTSLLCVCHFTFSRSLRPNPRLRTRTPFTPPYPSSLPTSLPPSTDFFSPSEHSNVYTVPSYVLQRFCHLSFVCDCIVVCTCRLAPHVRVVSWDVSCNSSLGSTLSHCRVCNTRCSYG